MDKKTNSFGFLEAQNCSAQRRNSAFVNFGEVASVFLGLQPLHFWSIARPPFSYIPPAEHHSTNSKESELDHRRFLQCTSVALRKSDEETNST
jgi:hypothetical protein